MRFTTEVTFPERDEDERVLRDGDLFYSPDGKHLYRLTNLPGNELWAAYRIGGDGYWRFDDHQWRACAVDGLLRCPPGTEIRIVVEE